MPTFNFTAPDGNKYTVNGPDGATEEQAFQMLQSQMAPAKPAAKPFGAQLNDAIADTPRQVGLTARYALQGLGNISDLVTTPIRAGLNVVLPDKYAIKPGIGRMAANSLALPKPRAGMESVVGDIAESVVGGAVPVVAAGRIAQGASGVTRAVAQGMAAAPAQQLVSAGAAGGAGGYVRETGGGTGAQLTASIAAGLAAPFAMAKGQQVGNRLSRMVRPPATSQADIDLQINTALQPSGIKVESLAPDVQAGIRRDVADALKISDTLSPDAVRRLADYRLTGTTPTAGGLTLDPGIVTRQKNLSKLGANSKDEAAQALSQTENRNNRILIDEMNRLGAGTPDTPIAGARKVTEALEARNARAGQLITDRYNKAKATNGRSAELDAEDFVTRANAKLNENLLSAKVPADVRNLLNKEWVDVMRGAGQGPNAQRFTVDAAEQMKTRIAALQRSSTDPAERAALGLVRGALDETPLLPGQQLGQESIEAFNKARSLNRAWMKIVERTPALEAVRDGIEPDKFVQQFIVGQGGKASVSGVKALHGSIKANSGAVSAVRGQIAQHLKAKALNGAADEVGNVSQSSYNKALSAIGDEKLSIFFTKPEIDQMKAIGRVASYEQVQPRGSAVNNSNTAGAGLAAIFDRLADSPFLSKIPGGNLISQPAQNISVGIRARQVMNVPQAIAKNRLATPARFSVSPLIGTIRDEDDRNELARKR